MKDKNWSYLAGIFDGEGCVHIAKIKAGEDNHTAYRLDVHITTTTEALAKWLLSTFGGVYYKIDMSKQNPKWNDAYRWMPKGKRNKETLFLGILPYLIVKREPVKLAIEFARLEGICPEKRRALYEACGKLTRRGKSVETNTSEATQVAKIESELVGNNESALPVTANA